MRRSEIAHPHPRQTAADIAELGGGGARQVDDPVIDKRSAVVHADDDTAAVFEIGDFDDGRNRQRRVRRGHRVLVEDFAIGRWPTMKIRSVPRCHSDAVIAVVTLRSVGPGADAVRPPDLLVPVVGRDQSGNVDVHGLGRCRGFGWSGRNRHRVPVLGMAVRRRRAGCERDGDQADKGEMQSGHESSGKSAADERAILAPIGEGRVTLFALRNITLRHATSCANFGHWRHFMSQLAAI